MLLVLLAITCPNPTGDTGYHPMKIIFMGGEDEEDLCVPVPTWLSEKLRLREDRYIVLRIDHDVKCER